MKIIRYSFTGFKPQYQNHHTKHINYLLNNFKLLDIPKHFRIFIKETYDKLAPFYKENYEYNEIIIVMERMRYKNGNIRCPK